jgi:S1-C subfamily serine protease
MMEAKANKPNSVVWCSRQRIVLALLVIVSLIGAIALVPHTPTATPEASRDDLHAQVHELTLQIEQLKQEQSMPAFVLSHFRNSIGYIHGVYHVGFANQHPEIRARVSGTGFLVGDHLVATNRHIAEPWYGDSDAEELIRRGAIPVVETLVIFFPGWSTPVQLSRPSVSKTSDLAVLWTGDSEALHRLPVLRLANSSASAGQFVTVVGYPMGIDGMLAKSPAGINERLAHRSRDINVAGELAVRSLIRPLSTCGHISDLIGDKLIYDAPTAHGGSGGPVFNSNSEVVGVNSAYIDGFSAGSIGISVESLRPLLQRAQARLETDRVHHRIERK